MLSFSMPLRISPIICLPPKQCNGILNGLCGRRSCLGYQQAAIYVLPKCDGITQWKNGRRIDYNPVKLR